MNDVLRELPPQTLTGREIHVWSVPTNASREIADRFEHLLAIDEQRRGARFRFDHLRRAFAVSRGSLRIILGSYLHIAPRSLEFLYGVNGKPAVDAKFALEFNTSHSGDLAVFAVTRACALGVDLERMRRIRDMQDLATRFFCAEEAAAFFALPVDERERAFFRCWTRKEAYIKATGEGMSASLNSFHVSLSASATLLQIDGSSAAAQAWTLHSLEVKPDYAAALAYRDRARPLTIFPTLDPDELLHNL